MSFRPKIEIEVEELTELIVNSKKNRKENVEIFADRENYKAGGVLWIFGESCICHSGENQPWVYFDYGFGFSIKPKDKEVKKVVYAQVSASNIKWLYFEKDINDTQLSCKAYLIKIFSELLLDTFAQAAKNSEISCARERFLKVIKKLKA
jgi:acetone carboxylase gamma subunit